MTGRTFIPDFMVHSTKNDGFCLNRIKTIHNVKKNVEEWTPILFVVMLDDWRNERQLMKQIKKRGSDLILL